MNSSILIPEFRVVFSQELREGYNRPETEYGLVYQVHAEPQGESFDTARERVAVMLREMFTSCASIAGSKTIDYAQNLGFAWMRSSAAERDLIMENGRNYIGPVSQFCGPLVWGNRGTHDELLPAVRLIFTTLRCAHFQINRVFGESVMSVPERMRIAMFQQGISQAHYEATQVAHQCGYHDPQFSWSAVPGNPRRVSFIHDGRAFGRDPETGRYSESDNIEMVVTGNGTIAILLTEHQQKIMRAMFPTTFDGIAVLDRNRYAFS